MPDALKYIVDENGDRCSVLVPVKTGKELNSNYKKLRNKIQVFTGIQNGLKEVRQAKKQAGRYKR